jgi:hypothetical protein
VLLLLVAACLVGIGLGIHSGYFGSAPIATSPATYVAAAVTKAQAMADIRRRAPELRRDRRIYELRKLVLECVKLLPNDPVVALYQAEIFLQQGRYPEADNTFAEALRRGPDGPTLDSFHASRVLARYCTGNAIAAYQEIPPRQYTFRLLAYQAYQDQDDDLLQALLDTHARNDPEDCDLQCYRCLLALRKNQTGDAIALLKRVAARPDHPWSAISVLLEAFAASGKAGEAYRVAGDQELAFEVLAEELTRNACRDELRQLIAKHARGNADDPLLAAYRGELLLEEKAWDQAARVFEEGLKVPMGNIQQRLRGRQRLQKGFLTALYRAGRPLEGYEKVGPRNESFSILAELMSGDHNGDALEALTRAHQPHDAGDPKLFYYQAVAKLLMKQPAEAMALFRKAYAEEAMDEQLRMVQNFILLAHATGFGMEAYRGSPNPGFAFAVLASILAEQKKDGELAALVAEHGRQMDADPECAFYQGELHLLRREFDKAVESFGDALATGHPGVRRYREGVFRARIKGGEVLRAYREAQLIPAETFAILAPLCARENAPDQLHALIDAHRQVDPEDAELPGWELEARWLDHDYEGALKLLAEHRDDVFTLPQWRWKANAYRIRCLVRLKRPAEAIRAAEAMKLKRTDSLILLLAYAAAGDVRRSIAVVESTRDSALLDSCYSDADLGPILRSEAFRTFREKLPEPKAAPGK